jgi:hypothetical protein
MLPARLRTRTCGGPLGPSVLVAALVLALFALVGPLAYASPPDETWVAGIYDAADCDDALALLTDPSMARPCAQLADIACYSVRHVFTSARASVRLPIHHGSLNPRAPPIPETTR